MEWSEIAGIIDERERIDAIYNKLDESKRLKQENSSWVEYLVIMSFLNKICVPNNKIIDIGAGTGAYSIPLADMGNEITAIDLVENNLNKLKEQIKAKHRIECFIADARNLINMPNETYDISLLMGPLYHLFSIEDRIKAIREALRVLKKGGYIFLTFMNNDLAPFFMMKSQSDYFTSNAYNCLDYRAESRLYVFHTIEEIREICNKVNIKICNEVAVDGLSLIYHKEIDKMEDLEFNNYMKHQMYLCEKKEFLAASSHILVIGQKSNI